MPECALNQPTDAMGRTTNYSLNLSPRPIRRLVEEVSVRGEWRAWTYG